MPPYDWRARATTTLAADVPPHYPGGPSHKAGAFVVAMTLGRAVGRNVGFATPSQEALALSAAVRALKAAMSLKKSLEFKRVTASAEPGEWWSVSDETMPTLFDFFEACYTVVAFSFQAIEAYANRAIAEAMPQDERFEITRNEGVVRLDAADVQRRVSTTEKLQVVLPSLLKVSPIDRSRVLWGRYKELRRERDATIHLKAEDAYPRAVSRQSIYHRFLDKGVAGHPETAVNVISHFHTGSKPDWLVGAISLVGSPA